ncbi:hypothetical protein BZG36_01141 [Bifiguratus adelaidae]|uniref:DH domain-containing protein n=1 Tax=Bifiguratus adelaidae TaxID=1938954 RepID=A0A261Y609_9FUNG|nr:hypothetical protein BZG36_01141 [Bifiguratus adelaidae]
MTTSQPSGSRRQPASGYSVSPSTSVLVNLKELDTEFLRLSTDMHNIGFVYDADVLNDKPSDEQNTSPADSPVTGTSSPDLPNPTQHQSHTKAPFYSKTGYYIDPRPVHQRPSIPSFQEHISSVASSSAQRQTPEDVAAIKVALAQITLELNQTSSHLVANSAAKTPVDGAKAVIQTPPIHSPCPASSTGTSDKGSFSTTTTFSDKTYESRLDLSNGILENYNETVYSRDYLDRCHYNFVGVDKYLGPICISLLDEPQDTHYGAIVRTHHLLTSLKFAKASVNEHALNNSRAIHRGASISSLKMSESMMVNVETSKFSVSASSMQGTLYVIMDLYMQELRTVRPETFRRLNMAETTIPSDLRSVGSIGDLRQASRNLLQMAKVKQQVTFASHYHLASLCKSGLCQVEEDDALDGGICQDLSALHVKIVRRSQPFDVVLRSSKEQDQTNQDRNKFCHFLGMLGYPLDMALLPMVPRSSSNENVAAKAIGHLPKQVHSDTHNGERRNQHIEELIHSEKKYGANLKILNERFNRPLQKLLLRNNSKHSGAIKWDLNKIYINVEELYKLHRNLLGDLLALQAGITVNGGLGSVLLKHMKLFADPYSHYLLNREEGGRYHLQLMEKNDRYKRSIKRLMKDCDIAGVKVSLQSLFMEPVQRIPRYKLLIDEILKRTPEIHPDVQDLRLARETASSIAMMMEKEQLTAARTFRHMFDTIQDVPATLFSGHRRLMKVIDADEIDMLDSTKILRRVSIYICNDLVMIVKRRHEDVRGYTSLPPEPTKGIADERRPLSHMPSFEDKNALKTPRPGQSTVLKKNRDLKFKSWAHISDIDLLDGIFEDSDSMQSRGFLLRVTKTSLKSDDYFSQQLRRYRLADFEEDKRRLFEFFDRQKALFRPPGHKPLTYYHRMGDVDIFSNIYYESDYEKLSTKNNIAIVIDAEAGQSLKTCEKWINCPSVIGYVQSNPLDQYRICFKSTQKLRGSLRNGNTLRNEDTGVDYPPFMDQGDFEMMMFERGNGLRSSEQSSQQWQESCSFMLDMIVEKYNRRYPQMGFSKSNVQGSQLLTSPSQTNLSLRGISNSFSMMMAPKERRRNQFIVPASENGLAQYMQDKELSRPPSIISINSTWEENLQPAPQRKPATLGRNAVHPAGTVKTSKQWYRLRHGNDSTTSFTSTISTSSTISSLAHTQRIPASQIFRKSNTTGADLCHASAPAPPKLSHHRTIQGVGTTMQDPQSRRRGFWNELHRNLSIKG